MPQNNPHDANPSGAAAAPHPGGAWRPALAAPGVDGQRTMLYGYLSWAV